MGGAGAISDADALALGATEADFVAALSAGRQHTKPSSKFLSPQQELLPSRPHAPEQ